MISILRATEKDYEQILSIGMVSVKLAHKESCSEKDMDEYLSKNYNTDAIKAELTDTDNIYYIINYNEQPAGFSKIVFNAEHPNIIQKNIAKLDRIYLLPEFHNLKLGLELLRFNIRLAADNHQAGIWLFTWIGNTKAVRFYLKNGFVIIGSHSFKVSDTHYNENHQMYLDLVNAR